MPFRRKTSRNWFSKIKPPGQRYPVGPFSTGTSDLRLARRVEACIYELARTRPEALDALRTGLFNLPTLYQHYITDRVSELLDPAAAQTIADALDWLAHNSSDERTEHFVKKARTVLPLREPAARLKEIRVLRKLKEPYAPLAGATERREFMSLSKLLGHLFGRQVRADLMEQLEVRRPDKGRDRYLHREEIARVREACGEWWLVICVALATGLRRSELLNLRVADLELDHGAVVIQHGKTTSARRSVPLGCEARSLLREWVSKEQLGPEDPAFPHVTVPRLRKAWDQVRVEAGVPDVRFHDLRHTFAVHAAKAGMPMVELMRRLGHSNIETTLRYAIYAPPTQSVHHEAALASMGL